MADESTCKFSDRAKDGSKCNHLSVVERYYTPKYKLGFGPKKDEDHCVLTHSNKVCLVTLAPSHPIHRDQKTVTAVDFQVDKDTNRLTNKVEGKSKKGATAVFADSRLCIIRCDDGSQYTVRCCLRGQVVEVNGSLVTKPELITQKPQTDGYVAIMLCKLKDYDVEMSRLLTQEEYNQEVNKRTATSDQTSS